MTESRYLRKSDPQRVRYGSFSIPEGINGWGSRPWEYAWAEDMLTGTDHVIDLGAGPGHFFTLHLSNCCGSVLGLDNQAPTQEQLNLFQFFPRLQWAFGFMEEPFGVNCFDAVSCISVLEHLTPEKILSSLYHMKIALTSAGRIVLTMDVPRVKVPWFWEQVEKVGLAPAGEHSLETSDDDVVIPVGRVYRAVLEKP